MTAFIKEKVSNFSEDISLLHQWDCFKLQSIEFAGRFWSQHKQRLAHGDAKASIKFKSPPSEINFLKDPVTGNMVTGKQAISNILNSFYKKLFTSEQSTLKPPSGMTFGLKKIPDDLFHLLSQDLELPDLEQALANMKPNKAPGCDGLTMEFYSKFWQLLGPIILRWAKLLITNGQLSGTAAVGVVTLIRKSGDPRDISNWRPIMLLTVDTKIILKAVANRLKYAINCVIPSYQNAIPGRSIFNSLSVIRDSISNYKKAKTPFYILSLDQQKAFDMVNHNFLFHLLTVIGLPDSFIKIIRVFYSGFYCCIKNVSYLTTPFLYLRGIRQGDPLATSLYVLALQPVLNAINLLSNQERTIICPKEELSMTVYADDVTIFLTNPEMVHTIVKIFNEIGKYSEAILNLNKSTLATFDSSPKNILKKEQHYCGITVTHGHIKILGIVFALEEKVHTLQWEKTLSSTKEEIAKTSSLLKKMTYSQRAKWVNKKLWPRWAYIFKVCQPTKTQINILTNTLSEAIWLGSRHWLPMNSLVKPIENGGIGMPSIQSRLDTFRVHHITQCTLTNQDSLEYQLMIQNLDQYNNAKIGLRILLTRPDKTHTQQLSSFYQAAYEAWDRLPTGYLPCDKDDLLDMPSFDSKPLHDMDPPFGLTASQAITSNAFTIRQFMSFTPPMVTRSYETLISGFHQFVAEWSPTPPPPCACVAQQRMPENTNLNLVKIKIPAFYMRLEDRLIHICSWRNKLLYNVLNSTGETLEDQFIPTKMWKTLEKSIAPPALKNRYWRFLHAKVASSGFFYNIGLLPSPMCVFCKDNDLTLTHQFRSCNKLNLIFQALCDDLIVLRQDIDNQPFQLSCESNTESKLANLLTMAYVYAVLETTKVIANDYNIKVSRTIFRDTFYSVLAKHVTIQATVRPPEEDKHKEFWSTLTFANLLARFDKEKLLIRSKDGFLPFETMAMLLNKSY